MIAFNCLLSSQTIISNHISFIHRQFNAHRQIFEKIGANMRAALEQVYSSRDTGRLGSSNLRDSRYQGHH